MAGSRRDHDDDVRDTKAPRADAASSSAAPPSAPPPTTAPRRGRRRSAPGDTRAAILEAATAEFSAQGYDAVSMRAVARRAGVDPALVHHYFDDKAALFTASIGAPIRPDRLLAEVLRGPRDQVGDSLVRILLTTLDEQSAQNRVLGIIATALRHPFAAALLRQFLVREVLQQVARDFGSTRDTNNAATDDGELRATLAASQIVGLIVARYGLRVEPLAGTPVDEVVRRVGPVIQWHLSGDPPLRSTTSDTL